MKRACLSLLVVFLFASITRAQEVPLEVKGADVRTVTVVGSLPFTVHAPATGGGLYFWTYPNTLTAVDKGDKLEVTAAPQGNHVVSVKIITADWENKRFVTKFGQVTFSIGVIPGPAPPVPIPPDSDFAKALAAAWTAAKSEPRAAENLILLTGLYRQAGPAVQNPSLATVADVFQFMKRAHENLLGSTPVLVPMRQAIAAELQRVLPKEGTTAMTAELRALCAQTFTRVADELGRIK